MDSKQVRASSPPPQLPPRKVCIVCTSQSEEFGSEYNIFIVDLNSGGGENSVDVLDFTVMDPTVRLDSDCVYDAAFCVADSTLYAFEGYNATYNPQGGKSVFSYKLPASNITSVKLHRSMFATAAVLNGLKANPMATVTPDGKKIVVFSSRIQTYDPFECDFEIFDPAKGICHKLPSLRLDRIPRGLHDFWIYSFSFMEKSVLLLRTELGIFTLNLRTPYSSKRWGTYGFRGAPFLPSHSGTSFVLIGKDICLLPFKGYDIAEPSIEKNEDPFCRWYYCFPDLSSSVDEYSFLSGGITRLEDDFNIRNRTRTRDCSLCFLQTGVNSDSMHPHMILEVYNLNLIECRKGLTEYRKKIMEEEKVWWKRTRQGFFLPGATKVKSFNFCVKSQQIQWFNLHSFSSIPAAITVPTRPTRRSSN